MLRQVEHIPGELKIEALQKRAWGSDVPRQQPDGGGETPGVAAAPVALAGAIVPGVARFIVMLSAHADVFGVGITPVAGSMVVPASCATAG